MQFPIRKLAFTIIPIARKGSINLADIMEAIKSMNGSMNEKFDSVESTLSQTLASLSEVTSRVTELEKASADYEGRISELEAHCRDWFETCKSLTSKLDDLEGRSRRQNIKIIGLPEKVEEGRPTLTSLYKSLVPVNFQNL